MTSGQPAIRVLHTLSGLQVGGIARLLLRNIRALRAQGVDSRVAYLVPRRNLEPAYREAGVETVCMGHHSTLHGPRTILRLVRLIRKTEPDIVHTNHSLDRLYAGLAARLCRIPAVTTIHETFPVSPGKLSGVKSLVERHLYVRYLAVSEAAAEVHLVSRGVPAERLEVIHSGIDPAEIAAHRSAGGRTVNLREELGLGPEATILINVARLTPPKGHEHLLRMMSALLPRHPEAVLLIVGEGDERPNLVTAIREAGLEDSIRLLGYRDDVVDLLAASTVFVFPSVRGEGLPMAVVEAMFAGKPIVAAATGPLREMVDDGQNGYLVEPANGGALATAIDKVVGSPSEVERMGARSRAIANERFHIDAASAKLKRAYLRVLEETQ